MRTLSIVSNRDNGAPFLRFLPHIIILAAAAILLFRPSPTLAAARTASVSGNWNSTSTWGGASVPTSADDATINAGIKVTVDGTGTCQSLTVLGGATTIAVTLTSTSTLTVTNAVTINNATGNGTMTVAVDGGTLNAGSISLTVANGTNANRRAALTLSTGTVNVTGNVSFGGISSQLTFTGAGTLNIGGNLGAGGTFSASTGVVNFNGSSASTAASYTYYTLKSNNPAGLTMASTSTITNLKIGDVTSNSIFSDGGYIITPGSGSALTLTSGTYKLGSTGTATTWPLWSSKTLSTGTTVEYAAGVAQAVTSTVSYQNLTFSGNGTKSVATSTTITVGGDWAVNSTTTLISTANATVTGNITGTGNIIMGSGTISVGGNWTNSGTFTAGTGTVNYTNASGGQTVAGLTYNNLTLSNSSATDTASGTLTVGGTFTTTAGGALNLGTNQLTGAFTASSAGIIETQNTGSTPFPSGKTWGGTVLFDGSSAQTAPTSTFNDLAIDNSAGVVAAGNISINNKLTLTSANPSSTKGTLDMGNNYVLTMVGLSTTQGAGDVSGSVFRSGPFTPSVTYSLGSAHTLFNFPNSNTVTNINAKLFMGSSPSWKADAIKRYWDFTMNLGAGTSTMQYAFHYLDSELNSNTEQRMTVWASTGTAIEIGASARDGSANYVTYSSLGKYVTSTSYTLADTQATIFEWTGVSSTNWNDPSNWSTNIVPASSDNVQIPDAATTAYDPQLPSANTEVKTMTIDAGGILNAAGGYSLTVNGGAADAPSLPAWSGGGTFNASTGTVIFTGSSASFTGTTSFNDVTIGPGATLYNRIDSTMRIAGTITNNGTWYAAYAPNSTIDYNGTDQTVVVPNGATTGYTNLTISGSGTKTLPASLHLRGNLTNNGTIDASGSTLIFDGSVNQTIGGTGALSLNNLTIGNAGYTAYVTHDIGVGGALTLNASTTLDMTTSTLSSLGSITSSGTLLTSSVSATPIPSGVTWPGTVKYQATNGQTIVAGTYNNLTLNETGGAASLGGNATVSGVLSLTAGVLTTGANAIYVDSTGSVNRAAGRINGNLKKYITTGVTSASFEVGDASYYAPVNVAFGSVSVGGDLTVKTTSGDHPNIGTAAMNASKSVNRYWTTTNSGITFTNYSATFNFDNADIDIGANTANFLIGKYSAGSWSYPTVGTRNGNYTQATGLTSFSDFQAGEPTDATVPTVTITASTYVSSTAITDTTIRITDDVGVASTTISAVSSTAGYTSLNCVQTSSTQVDCTISITSSGSLTINATDTSANPGTATEAGYTITGAPAISAIASVPADTLATLTWTTDILASSKVIYGLNTSYASTTAEIDVAPRVTSHSVGLSNLTACTVYHFEVVSRDALGNSTTSTDNTFITTGCTGGATVQAQSTQDVATTGGSLSLTYGGDTTTVVAPNAYSVSPANFQIKALTGSLVLGTIGSPTGENAIGSYVYDISANLDPQTPLTNFPGGITVTISYTAGEIANIEESSLTIYHYTGGAWSALSPCTINTTAKTVSCTTTSLSNFALFGTTKAATLLGGGSGVIPVTPTAMSSGAGGTALAFTVNGGSATVSSPAIMLGFNANPRTVKGYAASLDPTLKNSSIFPLDSGATFILPSVPGTYTVYLRYYSTTGLPSELLSQTVTLVSGIQAEEILNPLNLQSLQTNNGQTCDISKQDVLFKTVMADAKEFSLALSADQTEAIRNFVMCGNSASTIALGLGERRAVIRDYLQTVHRADVVWSDVERLATGQIPLRRNLTIERNNAATALSVFRRIFGHAPNYKVEVENLAWNTMLYRIRFSRDLVKETKGLKAYRALYHHDPSTPFSWAVVRVLGYVK